MLSTLEPSTREFFLVQMKYLSAYALLVEFNICEIRRTPLFLIYLLLYLVCSDKVTEDIYIYIYIYIYYLYTWLTHFRQMFCFYTPWKPKKTCLIFSRGIKKKHCLPEIVWTGMFNVYRNEYVNIVHVEELDFNLWAHFKNIQVDHLDQLRWQKYILWNI